jgi:hypothetical protein
MRLSSLGAFCPTPEREDSRRGRLEALLTRTADSNGVGAIHAAPAPPSILRMRPQGESEERRGV